MKAERLAEIKAFNPKPTDLVDWTKLHTAVLEYYPELVAEVERLQKGREISSVQIRQLFGEVARLKRVLEFIEQHADDEDIVRFFVKEALQNGKG